MPESKIRLCIWSQIHNDARNLQHFIEWHLSQGFEYFVFGDDRSDDNPQSVLRPYIELGIVKLYDAFNHGEKYGRYSGKDHFLPNDIVAFIDVDEYVRSFSGFAKSEIVQIFSDQNVKIVYLNWIFKHIGSKSCGNLVDYRDSYPFSQPDVYTKYLGRVSALQALPEADWGCHFISGIPIENTKSGNFSKPMFISPSKFGNVREQIAKNDFRICQTPSPWQLHPEKPKLWIDHYYTRNFDDYLNFKSMLGNKQGNGNQFEIRGMSYFYHGLGHSFTAPRRTYNSLNFRRIYPQLKNIEIKPTQQTESKLFKKKIYIHMGLPKTGTTAFQNAFFTFAKNKYSSEISYILPKHPNFKEHSQNGLELTKSARYQSLFQFSELMKDISSSINSSSIYSHFVSSEEFSAIDSTLFGLVKEHFSNQGIRTCGIAVIRPFKEFAISFFKQYIYMHVNMKFHSVLSYEQIAESARAHVERAIINCNLCHEYKVVNYSKNALPNKLINFIYQRSSPVDLTNFDQIANISLNFSLADHLYHIRQDESPGNESGSTQYLLLHESNKTADPKLPINHPYSIAIDRQIENLREFLSIFPYQNRWGLLLEDEIVD